MFDAPRIADCLVAHPRHGDGYVCGSLRALGARMRVSAYTQTHRLAYWIMPLAICEPRMRVTRAALDARETRDEPVPAGSKGSSSERLRTASKWPAAIHVAGRFSAPPERVFAAWLEPATAGTWLFATASRPMTCVEIDARVGGSFRFAECRDGAITEYTGEYLEIVPNRRLVFTLCVPTQHVITRTLVEISPSRKGCSLTLTHEHVPRGCVQRTRSRWTGILYGLGVSLNSNCI